MTPEQRARKNAADKARRLRIKEGTHVVGVRAIEPGGLVAPTAPPTAAEVLDAKIAATAVPAEPPSIEPPKAAARKPRAPAPTGPLGVITFKGTDFHRRAFKAAGGGAWLRQFLDEAAKLGKLKVPRS